ncbi:hypothetical protein [Serratia marcescens]|uniref:hypothetical protein n=1 Tax=Serratia marcescens TaxID=615 RepID=UPI0029DDB593|nr:hypothetical protein [Serratia marcescens]
MEDSKLENLLKFPLELKITYPDGTKDIYVGHTLTAKIIQAAATLQNILEAGKVPLLSMINHGEAIPIVEDLATLMLGCQALQVTIPADVLIRLRPPSGKARYIDRRQLADFNRQLNESLPSDCVSPMEASITQLQTMNRHLRQQPLERFLPPRSSAKDCPVISR